jgi:hypothetical protein
VISAPLLVNIGSLLVLLMYIYSITGVIIFGKVKRNYMMKDNLNFESFHKGFFTLFVISSTDWWSDIVSSFMKKKTPDFFCVEEPTYQDYVTNNFETIGCGPKYSGVLFFCSFFILMTLIMLKLFIAVILQAYNDIKLKETRLFNDETLQRFRDCWQDIDHEATGFIPKAEIETLLLEFGAPLEFKEPGELNLFVKSMNLTVHEGDRYAFLEVLDKLSLKILVIEQLKQKILD